VVLSAVVLSDVVLSAGVQSAAGASTLVLKQWCASLVLMETR